ncbi:outer membrane lipoprotein-sorting protein [Alphaproteobacteria bacterium]|nr:outer membrane lipoprotein-sorting protein [Alphaproteobacteria bacterium]
MTMISKLFVGATLTALSITSPALAEAPGLPAGDQPEARGLAIAKTSDATNLGYGDTTTEMEMILTNANGDVSERRLRFNTLENENPDDGDWSMMIFDEPRDVSGTAMLTYAHVLDADEQWMFLPALKRVKRISSVNKSGPFMGSEFAFEDFSSQEVGKYSYQWLRDEACGERTCHVTERRPLYQHSGYTRLISWTDTTDYQVRKIVYYDRKDALLKTLTFEGYRQYMNKYWRAHELFMQNHLSKKTTLLRWDEYEFSTGLSQSDFDQNSLKRTR